MPVSELVNFSCGAATTLTLETSSNFQGLGPQIGAQAQTSFLFSDSIQFPRSLCPVCPMYEACEATLEMGQDFWESESPLLPVYYWKSARSLES